MIGNLLTDLVIRGVDNLPRWGTEVQGNQHTFQPGGQARNLVCGLRALGIPASIIGTVGGDEAGRQILQEMVAIGVNRDGIEIAPSSPTGITVAAVRPDGERAFISDFASLALMDENAVLRHWDLVKNSQVMCLVGLFNLPSLDLSAAKRLLARARADGKVTLVDTGWDPQNWPSETLAGMRSLLEEVDIFLPNVEEALTLTQKSSVMATVKALADWGNGLTVVKCGEEGSIALKGREFWKVPALETKVYDAVGAGDVFNAGFLYGFLQSWELPAVLAFANATASIYLSRQQDRFPSASEVFKILEIHLTV